jgi:hypothetical protein
VSKTLKQLCEERDALTAEIEKRAEEAMRTLKAGGIKTAWNEHGVTVIEIREDEILIGFHTKYDDEAESYPLPLFENPNPDALSAYRDKEERSKEEKMRQEQQYTESREKRQLEYLLTKYGVPNGGDAK